MSQLQQDAPLSQLAQSLMEADASPRSSPMMMKDHMHYDAHHDMHQDAHCEGSRHGWLAFVFYFLVLALLFYFLYFALRPYFVLKQDHSHSGSSYTYDHHDEIDNGRLLGAAIVSALILIFVFWVFAWLVGSV